MIAIIKTTTFDFANEVPDRFTGPIKKDVTLDPIPDNLNDWPDGGEAPEAIVGESASQPGRYRVFKYRRDLVGSGFVSTGKLFGNLYMIYPA